jgi:hypothetical protein
MALVRRNARGGAEAIVYDTGRARDRLVLRRRLTYFGFELEREEESIDVFPPGREAEARHVLAEAVAKGEARHPAVRRNRRQVEEVRELYRRSGGTTPRLSLADLTARYEDALSDVRSFGEFRAAPLALDLAALVAPSERERLAALPDAVEVRGKWIEVEYDVEEVAGDGGEPVRRAVAGIRLPEELSRTRGAVELGVLDRPLRVVVVRGRRGAVGGA